MTIGWTHLLFLSSHVVWRHWYNGQRSITITQIIICSSSFNQARVSAGFHSNQSAHWLITLIIAPLRLRIIMALPTSRMIQESRRSHLILFILHSFSSPSPPFCTSYSISTSHSPVRVQILLHWKRISSGIEFPLSHHQSKSLWWLCVRW